MFGKSSLGFVGRQIRKVTGGDLYYRFRLLFTPNTLASLSRQQVSQFLFKLTAAHLAYYFVVREGLEEQYWFHKKMK